MKVVSHNGKRYIPKVVKSNKGYIYYSKNDVLYKLSVDGSGNLVETEI